jgi:hypothetical protein
VQATAQRSTNAASLEDFTRGFRNETARIIL